MDSLNTFYRSRLPHFTPIGGTFFVTFRINGSLPLTVMQALEREYSYTVKKIYLESDSELERQKGISAARSRYFREYDLRLDHSYGSRCFFRNPMLCEIMAEEILRHDHRLYTIKAFCIMPNHVHLLLSLASQLTDADQYYLNPNELTRTYQPLWKVLQRLKGASARKLNLALGTSGKFWQKDSYDHYVRKLSDFNKIVAYILGNPVKAGLVKKWNDYPHSYCR